MSAKEKRRPKGDVSSDVTADEVGVTAIMMDVMGGRSRCSDSERSVDSMVMKRKKLGSPKGKTAAGGTAAVPDAVDGGGSTASGARRPRKRKVAAGVAVPLDPIRRLKQITGEMVDAVFDAGVSSSEARGLIEHSGRYEELLMQLIGEVERLKGRLEVYEGGAKGMAVAAGAAMPPPAAAIRGAPVSLPGAVQAAVAPAPKPVETWSVVVKGKEKTTSKEVVKKVVEEVGPTLGVRVHEVRPIKDDGAVIRTPSVSERRKIVDNTKFEEVGLTVTVNDKLGPKIVVQRVHAEITPDEFMGELYALNLKEIMTEEAFRKSVRLVTGPWKAGGEARQDVNVVLECTPRVMEHLYCTGVYVKWFRFIVRPLDVIPACHRCLSLDHRVRECRMREDVCRRCGLAGHVAFRCPNDVRCRNCAFKGLPAGHAMLTAACPLYAAMVARADARH